MNRLNLGWASAPALAVVIGVAGACGSPSVSSPNDAATPAPKAMSSSTPSAGPIKTDMGETLDTSAGPIEIHPIHHATVWFKAGGKIVWIDPSSDANLDGPQADIILVTDIHPDHFDPKALGIVRQPTTHVIAPPVVAEKVESAIVMKNGDQHDEGPIHIEAIPMYNLKRGPSEGKLYHDKGRGNGYVITYGGKRIYFSGDTECTSEMRALQNIDIAFVCMNLPYTMPVDEAAECVKAFKPKVLVPYHYRGQNLDELDAPLAGSGVTIHKHVLY